MKIIESFITKNECYKIAEPMTVKGLMLHSIGCPQPRADVFARGWNDPKKEVAVHAFIDGNTGEVWQFLPWDICGWHAGGRANKTHIGVEMGEPDCIKYTHAATFECADILKARETVTRTYNTAVKLFAYLCDIFNLDPLETGVIIGHAEGHAMRVASNHADPAHIWEQLGLKYSMNTFRREVAQELDKIVTRREYYEILPGDTLYKIARKFGISVNDLANYNKIANPDEIIAGTYLAIPKHSYTVLPGDTLTKISKKYNITIGEICKKNNIADPNKIIVGQILEV